MKSPLLVTKLHPPSLTTRQVSRPHLIRILNEGLEEGRSLTLASAPVGFGKTTCIAEWFESLDLPATWLSLDPSDNDPMRFLSYLVAALQRTHSSFGSDLKFVLSSGELPEVDVAEYQESRSSSWMIFMSSRKM
jgi:LuxR family transcriptional regulator, maltose regulon positive regulatory protein